MTQENTQEEAFRASSLEQPLTKEEENEIADLAIVYCNNIPYCPDCAFKHIFHGNIDAFREAILADVPTLQTPHSKTMDIDLEWSDNWQYCQDPLHDWYPEGATCTRCGNTLIEAQADRTTDTDQIAIDRFLEEEENFDPADNSDLHADDFTTADLPESGY